MAGYTLEDLTAIPFEAGSTGTIYLRGWPADRWPALESGTLWWLSGSDPQASQALLDAVTYHSLILEGLGCRTASILGTGFSRDPQDHVLALAVRGTEAAGAGGWSWGDVVSGVLTSLPGWLEGLEHFPGDRPVFQYYSWTEGVDLRIPVIDPPPTIWPRVGDTLESGLGILVGVAGAVVAILTAATLFRRG